MKALHRFSPVPLVVLIASVASAADRPSADDIAKARAECHTQTARLAELERDASWCTDDQKLLQTRDAAEHSCAHSEDLLIAAGVEPKPAQPKAAPPAPPSITITEKVRTGATQTASAEPVAQFAAMEVDRRCEPGAKR
ncbi:MAG TPA: hypothetical protein VFB36_02590 [Nevskiaceae bacterium]|nr:hypothetical protein [Nevskiaceae bacterium]